MPTGRPGVFRRKQKDKANRLKKKQKKKRAGKKFGVNKKTKRRRK